MELHFMDASFLYLVIYCYKPCYQDQSFLYFLTFLMVYLTDVNIEMEFLGQMLDTSLTLHN